MSDQVKLRHLVDCVVSPSNDRRPEINLDAVIPGTGRISEVVRETDPSGQIAFEPGDVIFGKLRPYLAKSYLVRIPSHGSSEFLVLRSRRDVDPRFLLYTTLAQPWLDWATTTSYGTKMPRTSWEALASFPVPRMALDMQRRIADFLDDQVERMDQLVGLRARQSALAEELFKAQIDELYEGAFNPPLRSLLAQDPCYGVLVPEFTEQVDAVPLIRINNLLRPSAEVDLMPRITARQAREYRRTIVRTGDVLLSVVGSLDKAAIVPPEWSGANVNRPIARLVPRKDVPPEAIYGWTLTSTYMRDALLATGAGTAQATLNMGDLRRFRVPLPTNVAALAAGVRELLTWKKAVTARMETGAALLQERKRSLITSAVTGEFDVWTASVRAADVALPGAAGGAT